MGKRTHLARHAMRVRPRGPQAPARHADRSDGTTRACDGSHSPASGSPMSSIILDRSPQPLRQAPRLCALGLGLRGARGTRRAPCRLAPRLVGSADHHCGPCLQSLQARLGRHRGCRHCGCRRPSVVTSLASHLEPWRRSTASTCCGRRAARRAVHEARAGAHRGGSGLRHTTERACHGIHIVRAAAHLSPLTSW